MIKTTLSPWCITLAWLLPFGFATAADGGGTAPVGATPAAPPATITAAAWLQAQPKPKFRPGHTLPPLTRYGWSLPFAARVEFAENWGYALEFGGYVDAKAAELALTDPNSDGAKCLALAAKDPKTYRLAVICARDLPKDVPAETWTHDATGKFLNAKAESLDGTAWNPDMNTVYSPVAPDAVWQEAGRLRAEPLRRLREKAPLAIVLNGGEYGLGVLGFAQKVWEQDPVVLKAKGDTPWFDYISARKAHSEILIADTVKAVVPDRLLYIYYTTTGGTHRNQNSGWTKWMYGYEWMKPVSDLASSQHYYRHFNSGWTGNGDMLTEALNARGWEIANGTAHCYDWLCAGWTREKNAEDNDPAQEQWLGDLILYTGFLKCMYVAGMVGGNAGYYTYPKGGFGKEFPPDQPPHWLRQMTAFAHVHAFFSHLEEFLRAGELLPGPVKHAWSKEQPAYEFPTGDATARVLARQLRGKQQWLVAAWAAAGDSRDVKVTVPDLGEIVVQARPCGTVYRVTKDGQAPAKLELLDADGLTPSLAMTP